MEKDIFRLHQLLQEGNCCSAALLQLALEGRGERNPQLVQAASGLCGGVRSGLLCGALTGGALALGLYDPQAASEQMVPDLAAWFQEFCGETCGGTDCEKILAAGSIPCPELVENVWRKVKELLEDEGFEPAAGLEELQ